MRESAVAPLVSVVIAAFNAEATLGEQLAALSRQTASFAFEVLVCDNGSSDGTAAEAESWADRLPVTVIDASARRGAAAARNAGASVARSQLLVFCDADDVVADNWLHEMHAALQAAPFVAGTSRRPIVGPQHHLEYSTYRMPYFPQLPVAGTLNLGVSRAAFLDVGGFDEALRAGEDLDLCWRMQLAGHPLTAVATARVLVRNREGLRATFRQAYGYGVGDKRLRHKYAKVIPVFEGLDVLAVSFDRQGTVEAAPAARAPRAGVLGLAARAIGRVRCNGRPSVLVPRLGNRLGATLGAVDRSAPQLEAPAQPESIGR